MKRILTFAAVLAAASAASGTAFAAWSASSITANGTAKSLTMPTGATPTAPATSTGTVTLTWTAAQLSGADLTTYNVNRYPAAGGSGTAITCTSLTVSAGHTVTCTYTEATAGSYQYTETPTKALWLGVESAKSGTTVVTQGGPLTFAVTAPAGNKTAGTAFNLTITAQTGGVTDSTYTGTHTLSFSGPGNAAGGQAPAYPANVSFTGGVGTASVTLYKAETPTLTVSEATPARTGSVSGPVDVAAGARKLAWTSQGGFASGSSINGDGICYFTCDVKAFGRNVSWTSKVTVTDTYGNPVSAVGAGKGVTISKTNGAFTPNTATVTLTFPATGVAETTAALSFTSENNNSFTSDDLTATATGFAAGSVPANATTVFRRV
jgi:hypothetical protein